jgi:hypothetical protein
MEVVGNLAVSLTLDGALRNFQFTLGEHSDPAITNALARGRAAQCLKQALGLTAARPDLSAAHALDTAQEG